MLRATRLASASRQASIVWCQLVPCTASHSRRGCSAGVCFLCRPSASWQLQNADSARNTECTRNKSVCGASAMLPYGSSETASKHVCLLTSLACYRTRRLLTQGVVGSVNSNFVKFSGIILNVFDECFLLCLTLLLFYWYGDGLGEDGLDDGDG